MKLAAKFKDNWRSDGRILKEAWIVMFAANERFRTETLLIGFTFNLLKLSNVNKLKD